MSIINDRGTERKNKSINHLLFSMRQFFLFLEIYSNNICYFFCAEKIEPKADFNKFTVVCIFNEFVVKMKKKKTECNFQSADNHFLQGKNIQTQKGPQAQHLLLFSPS